MNSFFYNYLRSMRLYYCFVTGTTVLWGFLLGRGSRTPKNTFHLHSPLSIGVLIAVGFLAWGVNQIISDYLDRKEDAINAPHRPMVTGALKPCPALLLSACLLAVLAAASAWVSVWTLPVLVFGALLNAAYSWLKKIPVLNCLVYALAISCCTVYGYTGERNCLPDAGSVLVMFFYIVPIHFLMCHNSYYKDVVGDRATGVHTLQTCFPTWVSLTVSLVLFALHAALAIAFFVTLIDAGSTHVMLGCFAVHLALLVLLCWMHTRCLLARNYHRATRLHCELCVAMLYTFLLAYHHLLLLSEVLSLLAIEALFLWYRDEKE